MSYTYENKTGSSNWNQPCTVTVKLNDLDHAHYLALVIQEIINNQYGGDIDVELNFNGEKKTLPLGHDTLYKNVTLTVGE